MNAKIDQQVTAAIKGDSNAYHALVVEYSHELFRLAYRITGNAAHADDIVQDAFIKAFNKLSQFKANASFRTWIHRITVNTAMDYLRRNSTRVKYETQDDSWDQRSQLTDPCKQIDLQQQTLEALQQLTQVERSALTLRHYEGHSIQEICEILQLNTNACKNTIFRAVRKMRSALKPMVSV